uniref:Major facilitator superfamily (MFS) profile domain-containing protein n=1 Tax=Plectus sambesii TaxID=2011161 RepID=A0A914WUP8_9BILA
MARWWFWRLSLVVTAAGFCSQFQVYHLSAVNNVLDVAMKALMEEFGYDKIEAENQWAIATGAVSFGAVLGMLCGVLADIIGRRGALLLAAFVLLLAGVLIVICQLLGTFMLVIVGRALAGWAMGVGISAASLLIVESAPTDHRGLFSAAALSFFGFGDLAGLLATLPELLGTRSSWPVALAIGCLPAIVALPIIAFSPDSPRFLFLNRKNLQEAEKALMFYQGRVNAQRTREDLMDEETIYQQSKVTFFDLLRNRITRKSLLLACLVTGGGQVTGLAFVIAYSTFIAQQAGASHELATRLSIFCGIVKFVFGYVPVVLLEKCGRRPVALCGIAICAVAHSLAVLFLLTLQTSLLCAVLVALTFALTMIGYSLLIGAAYTYAAELFQQTSRAKALIVSNCSVWLVNAIIAVTFLPMVERAGVVLAIAPYAVLSWALFAVCYSVLPETKGLTFAQIANTVHNDDENSRLATITDE